MGKITDITFQKKDPKRVNISIDGEFAFGFSVEAKFLNKLAVGKNLPQAQINKLVESDQIERLINKAFKFLSFRPRSEKEVRDYLLRKVKIREIEKSDTEQTQYEKSVERVVQKLKNLDQINDKEFASWLVEQRKRFRPRGNRLIKAELAQKGIDKDIINEIAEENNQESEEELAIKAAQKKYTSYKKLNTNEFRTRLGQYLARRGFDWGTIKKVVDTLEQKELK